MPYMKLPISISDMKQIEPGFYAVSASFDTADPDAYLDDAETRKKKVGGIVYKRRTGLPLDEAEEALRSGILPEECGQIGREVEWFLRRYPGMRPAALIACERRAFENPAKGLRVTFDANIRCRDRDFDMTRRTAGTGLTEPSEILMEVKVPGAYPLWMAGLLWECGARQVHFSKYGTAWTDVILPRRTETKRVLSLGESERTEVRSIA